MKQFKNMSHSQLLDMLASYTTVYTQMLSDNIKTEEFYKCKRIIDQLAAEIALRKKAGATGDNALTTSSLSSQSE